MNALATIYHLGRLGLWLTAIGVAALLIDLVRNVIERRRQRERMTTALMRRGFRVAGKHGWVK